MYPQQIIDALRHVTYPGTQTDIVTAGMLEDDITISGFNVRFSLIFNKPNDPFKTSLIKACQHAIQTYIGKEINAQINVKEPTTTPHHTTGKNRIAKHVIGIHSGKGGVGKSTIAANIAVSFAQKGFKTGLLDADIHGPSIPKMFDCEDYQPCSVEKEGRTLIEPAEKYGVRILSLGFFIRPQQAIVWRGGMASNAIKQLIEDGDWGELDFFIIDLPPGTSDIHLTVINNMQVDGIVIVTTPQPIALTDAQRGVDMFQNEKIHIPILGIIENMAWFTPQELPNNKYYIFGKEGGVQLAHTLQLPLLAQVPIIQSVRENADAGQPDVLHNPVTKDVFSQMTDMILSRL